MIWGNEYRMRSTDSTAISVCTYHVLYSCCWASKDEEFCTSEMGLNNMLLQVLSNGNILGIYKIDSLFKICCHCSKGVPHLSYTQLLINSRVFCVQYCLIFISICHADLSE